MTKEGGHEITELLEAWRQGDQQALEKLTPQVYQELHRAAKHCMKRERDGHTLQTTALINELYLRLTDLQGIDWQNRAHFFALCARQMRRILTDQARARQSDKRGGDLLAGASPEEAAAEATEFRRAFQTSGQKGYWQKKLDVTLSAYRQAGTGYPPALALAGAYAKVGDKEQALEWLQKSYEERNGNITLVKSLPEFNILHGDPRFADLLRHIGLPD